MDTEEIKRRNLEYLKEFFNRYDLNGRTFEDFDYKESGQPYKITSIYLNFKDWSFVLYGNEKVFDENEKIKFKKIQLYNFSKKKIEKLDIEEIYQIRADFIKFTLMFNQLKDIYSIEQSEEQIDLAYEAAKISMLSSLK